MHTKNSTKHLLGFAVFFCILIVPTWKIHRTSAQSFCIGEVYGTPGCPLKEPLTIPPLCGDAVTQDGEECDRGYSNGLTNCTVNCRAPYCGDGIVTPFVGEDCEPLVQEVYAEDPLTGDIVVEVQYMTLSCGQICSPPTCTRNGGCTGGCLWETLQECTKDPPILLESADAQAVTPIPTLAAALTEVRAQCGNGIQEEGEECDDGNFRNTDDCLSNCTLPVCGNRIREGTEECDDGNNDNNDGCTNICLSAACGDGYVQEGEECDLGHSNRLTNCTDSCTFLYCGDGIVSSFLDEECEPLTEEVYVTDPLTGDITIEVQFITLSCEEACSIPSCTSTGGCTGGCRFEKIADECVQDPLVFLESPALHIPTLANAPVREVAVVEEVFCGNGIQEQGEDCDLGQLNGLKGCTERCTLFYCGDGIVSEFLGEQCEPLTEEVWRIDPVTGDRTVELQFVSLSCGQVCSVPSCNTRGVCTGGCLRTRLLNACAQDPIPTLFSTFAYLAEEDPIPTLPSAPIEESEVVEIVEEAYCGNGIQEEDEECDDGNTVDDDRCTNSCKTALCGDGIVQEGEECDVAKNNSDSIKDACRTDCSKPVCGDSVQDSGEECDDGNDNAFDSCTAECRATFCGDSIVQDTEECDDGHNNSDTTADVCRSNCVRPICGDSVKDTHEECDGSEDCTEECTKKNAALLLLTNGTFIAGALSLIALFFFGGIATLLLKKHAKSPVAEYST